MILKNSAVVVVTPGRLLLHMEKHAVMSNAVLLKGSVPLTLNQKKYFVVAMVFAKEKKQPHHVQLTDVSLFD